MGEPEERYWMKEPCGPCPFSRSKTLWLHPDRAHEFGCMAQNPYNEFPCHKTADVVEDDDGSSEYRAGEQSFVCNGFLSLQCRETDRTIPGFEPHDDAFEDYWEMTRHHEDEWDRTHA